MTVYTYSEARQHLAEILDLARAEGAVQIRRKDGSLFQVTPVAPQASPLDVGYLDIELTREEIVAAVRESRARALNSAPLAQG
jgi:antitoxin (DNA-binding transcriptional repressor) of toxin-antitoxin stability system